MDITRREILLLRQSKVIGGEVQFVLVLVLMKLSGGQGTVDQNPQVIFNLFLHK